MALTTLVFLVAFAFCLLGSIFIHPLLGVIGYVMTYVVAPATHWWGVELAQMGARFSFFMAIAIALGMLFNAKKLNFPGKLYGQEILFLLLIGWIFLSSYIGLPSYNVENYALKLLKVAIFLWMLIRIVDNRKSYEIFLWALVLATAYVGFDALGVSTAQFGRLDRGAGGSDFAESNFLAAHFSMVLPFIGVFFMKGTTRQKVLLLVAAVLVVNGIVLCRSRGALVALALGFMAAIYYAPRLWRTRIVTLTVIASIVSLFFLVDEGFLRRMQLTPNFTDYEVQESSVGGRLLAWQAAIAMTRDHPLGIGQGNFFHYVGYYQPDIPGKDAHNTYLRAAAELGLPGVGLLLTMIWNAFRTLRHQKKRIEEQNLDADLHLYVYALGVALVIFLAAGMFITETYIEEFYWLLMMPLLLERVVDRALASKLLSNTTVDPATV